MGSSLSAPMIEAQKSGQLAMFERQVEMQKQIARKQLAMQLAARRDLFHFFAGFSVLAFPALIIKGLKTGNKSFYAPLLPLGFILAYQYDGAYGSKVSRIRADAENLLTNSPELFELPHGFPSVSSVDQSIATKKGK
eukprot:gnl/Spiro4/23266_TR11497_c0_g1_i1.p1 gnl/Spiro4/23266_TR11497_c0_g1~~gnl/Spiro4/23266_TR11497_c0_g1_i1.p1  ORF type:complete len:137 (-),score=24.51 gnl/Spiro4/23266_TR11497_c0_g1_i1:70-480(-)